MKSLQEYITEQLEYPNSQLDEGLIDWIKGLFRKAIRSKKVSTKRRLLPAKAKIDEIKFSKKPLDNYEAFKRSEKTVSASFPITTKMLNEMTKRTYESSNDKLDLSKCKFVEFVYKPTNSFKDENYLVALAGYAPDQTVLDDKHAHILFFEGDTEVLSNWKNIRDDVFKIFVDKFVKKTSLSMWYINNITELPLYNGKRFEDITSSKNKIAKID